MSQTTSHSKLSAFVSPLLTSSFLSSSSHLLSHVSHHVPPPPISHIPVRVVSQRRANAGPPQSSSVPASPSKTPITSSKTPRPRSKPRVPPLILESQRLRKSGRWRKALHLLKSATPDQEHNPQFLNETILLTVACLQDTKPGISAVQLYTQLRRVAEAIPARADATTFNAILSGLKGRGKEGKGSGIGEEELKVAEVVFEDMVKEAVCPDHFTMSILFYICGSAKSLFYTDRFLQRVRKYFAFELNVISGTALVNAYAKCGEMGKAEETVTYMKENGLEPSEWTYGVMISAYIQKRSHNRAKQWFREAVESVSVHINQFLVSNVLASCMKEGDAQFVRWVYEVMIRKSVAVTEELLSVMFETAVRGGDINLGIEILFEWRPKHGVVAATPELCARLIAVGHQAQTSVQERARSVGRVVPRMVKGGLKPTVEVLNALISTYVKLELHADARRVLEEDFSQYGTAPNVVTYNTLIHGLGKLSRPELVVKVVQVMRKRGVEPNEATFNVMMDILLEHRHSGLAALFAENFGKEGWKEKQGMTVSAQFKLFRASKKGNEALELYRKCVRRKVEPDAISYGVLMCTLYECGMESETRGILGRLFVNRDVTCGIANVVMEQWSRGDECAERCLLLLEKMKRCEIAPDEMTYTTLIKALSRAGLVERAFRVLGEMQDVGLGMGGGHVWSALIDACGKNGQWERGVDVLRSMRAGNRDGTVPRPSVECYNAGLYGAGMHGEWQAVVEVWEMVKEEGLWNGVTLSVMGSCVLKNRFKIAKWRVVREVFKAMNEWMEGEKGNKTEITRVKKKMARVQWLLERAVEGKRLKRGAAEVV